MKILDRISQQHQRSVNIWSENIERAHASKNIDRSCASKWLLRRSSVTKQQKILFAPTIWIWRVIRSNLLSLMKFSQIYSDTAAEKDGTVLFYLWRVVICKLKMKGEALHNDWMDYLCRIMAFSDQNLTPKAKQIKLYICISMFKLKLFCITVSNQQYFTSMRGFVKVPKYLHVYCIHNLI